MKTLIAAQSAQDKRLEEFDREAWPRIIISTLRAFTQRTIAEAHAKDAVKHEVAREDET